MGSYPPLSVCTGVKHLPPPNLIRQQLQRILASSSFDASARNRRFLEYVVERALEGEGERLKGYTIAVEVFDRDAGFDAQLDPVVRIEAGRLRRSLERYYLTEGHATSVVIRIPKGAYIPMFELGPRAQQFEPFDAKIGPAGDHLSLVVAPMAHHRSGSEEATFDTALMEEIIAEFYAKHRDIEILVPAGRLCAVETDFFAASSNLGFLLRSSVRRSRSGIRIIFQVANRHNGRLLWTQSFDQDSLSVDIIATPREIARDVVDSIVAALSCAVASTLS